MGNLLEIESAYAILETEDTISAHITQCPLSNISQPIDHVTGLERKCFQSFHLKVGNINAQEFHH